VQFQVTSNVPVSANIDFQPENGLTFVRWTNSSSDSTKGTYTATAIVSVPPGTTAPNQPYTGSFSVKAHSQTSQAVQVTRLDDINLSVDKEYDSWRNIQGLVKASESPTNILKSTYKSQDLFTVVSTQAIKNWVWTFVPDKDTTEWARKFSDNIKVFNDDTSTNFTIRYVENTSITPPRAGAFIEGHLVAKQGDAVQYTSNLKLNISFEGGAITIWTPKELGWPIIVEPNDAHFANGLFIDRYNQTTINETKDPLHLIPPTSDNLKDKNIFHLRPFKDKTGEFNYLMRVTGDKCLYTERNNIYDWDCSKHPDPNAGYDPNVDFLAFQIFREPSPDSPFTNIGAWRPQHLDGQVTYGWYFVNKRNYSDTDVDKISFLKLPREGKNSFHQDIRYAQSKRISLEMSEDINRSTSPTSIQKQLMDLPLFYVVDSETENYLSSVTLNSTRITPFATNYKKDDGLRDANFYDQNKNLKYPTLDNNMYDLRNTGVYYGYYIPAIVAEDDDSDNFLKDIFKRPSNINLVIFNRPYSVRFDISLRNRKMTTPDDWKQDEDMLYVKTPADGEGQRIWDNDKNREIGINTVIDNPFESAPECTRYYWGQGNRDRNYNSQCYKVLMTYHLTTKDTYDSRTPFNGSIHFGFWPSIYLSQTYYEDVQQVKFMATPPMAYEFDASKLATDNYACTTTFTAPFCVDSNWNPLKKEFGTTQRLTYLEPNPITGRPFGAQQLYDITSTISIVDEGKKNY
ncbi:hypothetical protein, partial [Paraphotobacterium marinum]